MNKLLSTLGLVRRAARLSIGLNETVSSAKSGAAKLIAYAKDFNGTKYNIPTIKIDCTMEELSAAIGVKAGVVAVNDKGFAEKLYSLYELTRKDESAI